MKIKFFRKIIVLIFFVFPLISFADIDKSPNDNRLYKAYTLDNKLKVVLVSDKDAEIAGVTLNVGVGSFDDPTDRAGLAHFLEHMLFLGTKKFPKSGEYSEYIKQHGGYNNAYTSKENTAYLFSVLPEYLDSALDRFSQFFISPLFNSDLVDREKNAVDSEYKLNIKNDPHRIYNVLKATSNSKHPFSKFSVGNLDTLSDKKHSKTRDELIKFYNKYYNADNMTLAIVSSQSIEDLTKMADKYFSKITNKSSTIVRDYNNTNVFDYKLKDIHIKSIGDHQELSLIFPIVSQKQLYKTKPSNYIINLLNYSGKNSLLQILKQKDFITDYYASLSEITNSEDLFEVNFTLTDLGKKNINLITKIFFDYVGFIDKNGVQEWRFDELKKISIRNFRFLEKTSPLNYSTFLADQMHYFPSKDLITESYLLEDSEYKPKNIKNIINQISVDNMRRLIISKNVVGNKKEKYYGVEYREDDLNSKDILGLKTDEKFELASKNLILPSNFEILSKKSLLKPKLIIKNKNIKSWYILNTEFKQPKVYFDNYIIKKNCSAKDIVLLNLYSSVILDSLDKFSSKFSLAGVGVNSSVINNGINISINSYSDKLENLIDLIFSDLINPEITEVRFKSLKDDFKRELVTLREMQPIKQAFNNLKILLIENKYHYEELLKIIDSIDFNDLVSFQEEFLKNSFIENFIAGNITEKKAVKLSNTIKFKINNKYSSGRELSKYAKLSDKINLKIKTEHKDNVLIKYYQANKNDFHEVSKVKLLEHIISSKFYEELRTNQQLGYVVGTSDLNFNKLSSLMFYVESPNSKPKKIENSIDKFVQDFHSSINNIDKKEFNKYKKSLKDNILRKPKSLYELTSRYWDKILDGTYNFEIRNILANEIDKVSIRELKLLYNTMLVKNKSEIDISIANDFKGSDIIKDINKLKSEIMYVSGM